MAVFKKSSPPLRVEPQPTLKIEKSARTRAAIMNAGLEFLWSHPFRDMTVDALMTPTGLSRSAFYQYFKDQHDLMKTLLIMVRDEIFAETRSWFEGVGDPVALLNESLAGLVDVCHRLGPILRATDDATATDKRLEQAWTQMLGGFDDSVAKRIKADQKQGLIPDFSARPVAVALNRLDAYTLIHAFGQRPRSQKRPVHEALARIWISTLYGERWLDGKSSDLVRT